MYNNFTRSRLSSRLEMLGLSLLFLILSLTVSNGQGYLQIVTPSCTQYTSTGCSVPCTCAWATDATIDPCSTLSYGNVEAGLTRIKAVTIKNSNGSPAPDPLNVTISLVQDPSGDFRSSWEIVDDADVTPLGGGKFTVNPIAPGAQVDLEIKFKPSLSEVAGGKPVRLLLTSSNSDLCYIDADPTNNSPGNKLDVTVGLMAFSVKAPINFALVLDKSGSMDQIVTGSTKRIDLLKTASKYFIDLLSTRNNSTDKVLLVKYSDTPDVLSPLGAVNSATTTPLINGLTAFGSTATGAGLEMANSNIGAAPSGGKNVTVLFTDGEENVPPWMAGANTANSSQVFTVGMSNLVTSTFQTALSNYATAKNGKYYFVPETTVYNTSALPVDLQKAYLSVFTDASGLQGVVDPVYQVHLDGTEKLVGSAWVTSSDHKMLFSIYDDPAMRRAYDLEIRSPKGVAITNGTFGSAMEGKIITGDGYYIYNVDFSKVTDETDFVGKWSLYLKPKEKASEKQKEVSIGFVATSLSDLQMDLGLGSTNFIPGNTLNIALDFTEAGVQLKAIKELFVKLTTPSGNVIILKPTQDNFGKWVTNYPHTYEAGTYQLFVRATIANSKGQITTREQTRYYAFGIPPVPNDSTTCLPCRFIKIIIAIAILLLLFILILALRKKK